MRYVGMRFRFDRHQILKWIGIIVAVTVAACGGAGGGGGGTTGVAITIPQVALSAVPVPGNAIPPPGPYKVTVAYTTPNGLSSKVKRVAQRYLQYISTSNASISVVVTPLGGSAMSPVVGSCTTVTCNVTFTANAGPNQLAFTLTDTAGGGGNVLSTFTMFTIVQPTTLNTLALTANPIVNSVTLSSATSSLTAGTPADTLLTVNALDADGKTIVGTGNYVNASGTPLALLLSATNNQAGGSGSIVIKGPLRITAPGQASIYTHYDGGWLNSSTISVSSTQSIGGTLGTVTMSTVPTIAHEYYVGTGTSPNGLTVGPDGNIWFVDQGTNMVVKMVTSTGSYTAYPMPTANITSLQKIVAGPDGAMWFTANSGGNILRTTLTGSITKYVAGSGPVGITVGSDGNIWYANQYVSSGGVISPTQGILAGKSFTTSGGLYGMTTGPDKNVWFDDIGNNSVGKVTPLGVVTEYAINTASAGPYGITTGPDGNIWYTENYTSKVGCFTTAGVRCTGAGLTNGESATITGGALGDIVSAPNGDLFFTEHGLNKIGEITTAGVIVNQYPLVSGTGPFGIVLGPDGNIWFGEQGGGGAGDIGVLIL